MTRKDVELEITEIKMSNVRKNVKVVVLGDIGRSPRMQYHSLSLAEMGHRVDIIGYGDTDPMDPVKEDPLIFYHYLWPVPQVPQRYLNYIFKTICQAFSLLFLLLVTTKADALIVQNPPAIPTLVVCWIYTKIVRAKFIIDWHNYAHTIMALNVGKKNLLVKATKKVEVFLGQRANENLCVTRAMKDDLKTNWNVNAVTLYDKPPERFKSISLEEKHEFFLKFSQLYTTLSTSQNDTVFTEVRNNTVMLKEDRPGLLVSSTSWTEDEDFSVLLSALQDYEDHYETGNQRKLPELICVITGKGALKDFYISCISERNWKHVRVITPWLQSEDYPTLLASADLGVSLHTSSSGLDLPMKVVDMFGCGLPVCAFDFKCLHELIQHGKNGYVFKTSQELSGQIFDWFEDFPNNTRQRIIEGDMKAELKAFQRLRWRENWMNVASPIFT